jgi:glucose/mannose-6-phosphate isomerase
MGGSGIPGYLLKNYCFYESKIIIEVENGYDLPKWVDENTLLFLISYSGNTEETLSCLKQALEKKAKIVAISSGGLLNKAAKTHDLLLINAPEGLQPRAATPILFAYLLEVLRKIGLINPDYNELMDELKKLDLRIESENIAKDVANGLFDYLGFIFIYVPRTLESSGLRIMAQDFNENAKLLAKFSVIPEANHNETCAWRESQALPLSALFIIDPLAGESINARMEFQMEECKKKGARVIVIEAKGKGLLARLLTTIYIGDMVSYYLALLRHKNPLPVRAVEELKKYVEGKTSLKNRLIDELSL